jgi:molybdate transport system substrate-binding protein
MKAKAILVTGAQAAEDVARGEAELGVAQGSEIVPVAGARLVGPLPGDFASMTTSGPASVQEANRSRPRRSASSLQGPRPRHALRPRGTSQDEKRRLREGAELKIVVDGLHLRTPSVHA